MLKVYHSVGLTKFGASFTAIYPDRYTTRSPFSVVVASETDQIVPGDAPGKRSKGGDASGDLASRHRISNQIDLSEEKHGSR
jgi:hypothetical protein